MEGSLAGKLLIAMPQMGDPRFDHAVILMCLHNEDQAMGLVLNKPNGALRLGDVLKHLEFSPPREATERAVLFGGPVKTDRGYVLHSQDFAVPQATQDVSPGIALTASREVLEAISSPNPPHNYVFALGYAGWGPGQLEGELAQNAWLIAEPDDAIVFDEDFDNKWARAISQLGIHPSQIMGDAGRA
ncbi:MAG TPA: YqgE/AlgH family protein [Caulobacterales bacterium]|jgi:putative transcriptional regulator|nr:YqgE/AlgH family protein [Caulobacterales bacterium]